MSDAKPRTVIHRSRIDRLPEEPREVRLLDLADWLRSVWQAELEIVAERPAFWENTAPWDTGWRSMPWHLLILVVHGSINLHGDQGEEQRLGAGAMFWTPPRTRHRVVVHPGRYYFLRFRLLAADGANLAFDGIRVRHDTQAIEPLFELLCDDLRLDHPHLAARLRALLVLLASADPPVAEAGASGFSPALRRRLAQIVHERIDVGVRPADLAEAVGMSPVAFARRFRTHFGCSARRWLTDQRLRMAARCLLSGSDPIAAVAAQAGFANPSQFARQFHGLFGVNPAVYRKDRGVRGCRPSNAR